MKGFTPVILLGLTIGAIYFYVVPQIGHIQDIFAEVEKYDDALEAADVLDGRLQELNRKKETFTIAETVRLGKLLPSTTDDVRLVLDVSGIAENYNIELTNIVLETLEEEEPNARERITRPGTENERVDSRFDRSSLDLQELHLGFSFFATYAEFVNFITDLESSLRILDITEISFNSENPEEGEYLFSVSLKTSWVE